MSQPMGLLILLMVLVLAACGDSSKVAAQGKNGAKAGGNGASAGGPGSRPKQVGYVVARQSSVPIVTELPGRATPYRQSEVRPQVSGVIRRRLFTEGAQVKAGQPLYEIDASVYQAQAAVAEANLQNAQANAEAARTQADRYKPLAAIEAVSQQEYTNAEAAAKQAVAQVAQTRAQLQAARINLNYTTVPAPISGRIGRSLFTQGALVTANQPDPLASISQLDPIFVDIQQPSAELLSLRRSLAQGGVVPARAEVRLKLQDGSDYGEVGKVEFSEVLVDPNTSTVTVRARFANPDSVLLPGMFVRARFAQSIDQSVILVPQAAVSRDPKGAASVFIVGDDGKAQSRPIKTERTLGPDWIVTDGIKAGDRIIVQGTSKLRPGQPVQAVPADTPQTLGPPGAASSSASGASGAGAAALARNG